MSSVKIEGNASGTGIFTIASPNSNTNRTLTLPDNTGTFITTGSSGQSIPKAALPTGSVLQVVSTTKTDTFTTTSTSFTDITGLSVSITPTSSTSRIFVSVMTNVSNDTGGQNGVIRLVRDSTAIAIGVAAGSRPGGSAQGRIIGDGNGAVNYGVQFVDSPATTAATTYKVQMLAQGGTGCVNRTFNDTDSVAIARTVSTITVMEIAA